MSDYEERLYQEVTQRDRKRETQTRIVAENRTVNSPKREHTVRTIEIKIGKWGKERRGKRKAEIGLEGNIVRKGELATNTIVRKPQKTSPNIRST